jgi:hypothetical protein
MTTPQQYTPGPANLARVQKDGENWTLVLVRQLRHSPEKVWRALTDPAQLREWAPFDADGNMGIAGSTVKLAYLPRHFGSRAQRHPTRPDRRSGGHEV